MVPLRLVTLSKQSLLTCMFVKSAPMKHLRPLILLLLMPLNEFRRNENVQNYGGGWYDRLLADAPKDAVKLGVAHSFQIVEDLPTEPHDIQLTAVVDDSLV